MNVQVCSIVKAEIELEFHVKGFAMWCSPLFSHVVTGVALVRAVRDSGSALIKSLTPTQASEEFLILLAVWYTNFPAIAPCMHVF